MIEIETTPLPVKLKKRGRFLVVKLDQPITQLTRDYRTDTPADHP
ncbi:MAG: hypothetical protein P0121_08030 [Nitrospira sp.]|nr:hypothetical protein [Nitrospira sp.]